MTRNRYVRKCLYVVQLKCRPVIVIIAFDRRDRPQRPLTFKTRLRTTSMAVRGVIVIGLQQNKKGEKKGEKKENEGNASRVNAGDG